VTVRDEMTAAVEPGGPIHEFAKQLIDERGFVGVDVAIADGAQTLFSLCQGRRDKEAELPMTDDTIVRIYSMTKPVVSTALMTLFDQDRFQLEDPVANFLPRFRNLRVLEEGTLEKPVRPITVRDLLTHTCGMTNELQDTPVAALYQQAAVNSDPTRPLSELIDLLAELPLAFHPGQRWHYGMGIDMAAGLVEVLADQPLSAFLSDRFFGPLGMPDTGFGVPEAKRGRLAAMYGGPDVLGRGQAISALVEAWSSGANERRDVTATYPPDAVATFARGGFGLFSTAADYTRFARMLLNGGELDGERVVEAATVELMRRNHLPSELLPFQNFVVPVPGYGFGLGSSVLMDVAASGAVGSVGDYGWSGAASTHFWVDPQLGLTVVLMAQSMMRMDTTENDLKAVVHQALTEGTGMRQP
jgi:CubicO group peptidase (beta-lactamase class C family)